MNPAGPRTEVAARKLTGPLVANPPATVTRDGRYAAYVYMPRSVVMLVDLTTGKERELGGGRRLIPPGDFSNVAAISPDGSTVAYNHVHADGTCDLRLIGVNATEPRILLRGLNHFYVRDWSRDGSTVLINETGIVATNPVPPRSLLVNVNTGEMKTVFSWGSRGLSVLDGVFRGGLRLSPDGRFLASSLPEAGPASGTVVFVAAVGDGKPHKVAWSPEDAYVFGWSPDGQQLLYVSDQSGTYDLWAVPVKDAEPHGVPVLLKKDLGMVHATGIADDGSLHYATPSARGDVYLGELDVEGAVIRNLQQVPAPRGLLSLHATWSPDGSRLLIDRTSYPLVKGSVPLGWPAHQAKGMIRDVATGEEREAKPPEGTAPAGRPYDAGWSPDGKSMVFEILRSNPQDPPIKFVVADLETGVAKSQIEVPASRRQFVPYHFPTVTPDGRQVYTSKGGNMANATRVVRIDLETGEEKEICAARPLTWALSPDGSQLACAGLGDGIQVLPTQGGPGRDLVKGEQIGPLTWTADGKQLIYTTPAAGSAPGGPGVYWIIPAAGGTPRKMDVALGRVGTMSVHPDNRHIAISSYGGDTELWVLENLLHASK